MGRGPNVGGEFSQEDYHHPAAGWGAARSVAKVLGARREPIAGTRAILRMNHENGGFDCPGCAWPDDTKGLHLDICENGIKHVTWEMTRKRVDREFFAAPHGDRAVGVERLRARGPGPADRADGLRPRVGQVRADLVDGRVRAGRRHAARAGQPEPGVVLHVRAGSATRRPSSTSCGPASSAPTTCRTARTCATRPAAAR